MIATAKGLWSCSADGQTVFADAGNEIPPCSCNQGNWELLAINQAELPGTACMVLGLLHVFEAKFEVKTGAIFNFRSSPESIKEGAYRIIGVAPAEKEASRKIRIVRIGDFKPELPIHIGAQKGV